MTKTKIILLALVIAQFLAPSASEAGRISLSTVVKASQKPAVVAGYVGSWVRVVIEPLQNEPDTNLYIIYSSENQIIPIDGQICEFQYHLGTVSGLIGQQTGHKDSVRIVDSFKCHSGAK